MWTWKSCLRFTIRELALIAVIVGLALAWQLDRNQLTRQPRYTGEPLDLAIEGKGYFQVLDETTAQCAFTRSGRFSVNDQGLLVARLGGREWPINPAICIPDEAAAITISPSGRVSVLQREASALLDVGQLLLADFDNPGKMRRVAATVYDQTAASGRPLTSTPNQQGFGKVLQGVLDGRGARRLSFSAWRR